MDGGCDCTYFQTFGGTGVKVDIFNTDNKYQIIYADPPWEYKQSRSKTNSRGMADVHVMLLQLMIYNKQEADYFNEVYDEMRYKLERIKEEQKHV
jgi:hypothetical protein